MVDRLSLDSLPIDNVFQIGAELTGHLNVITNCERCVTTKRTMDMLTRITSRLVSFYEAAFQGESASLTATTWPQSKPRVDFLPTSPPSHHGGSGHLLTMTDAPECQSVLREIKLGKLSLNGSEARLLIEVVLVEACLELNEKIQEWKFVMDELLEKESQHGSDDDDVYRCLNRLAKLIGLLHFDRLSMQRL